MRVLNTLFQNLGHTSGCFNICHVSFFQMYHYILTESKKNDLIIEKNKVEQSDKKANEKKTSANVKNFQKNENAWEKGGEPHQQTGLFVVTECFLQKKMQTHTKQETIEEHKRAPKRETESKRQDAPLSFLVVFPQIAIAIGVLTSNRGGGRRTTLADWTWHQGAIAGCSGRGAIAGCHRGCHFSVLWLGGRVTTKIGGVGVVPL